MPTVRINGLDIAYHVAGDGPPLLLLHGYVGDRRMWRPQLETLPESFTVIAWDNPGTGASSDAPESWRFPDYADCLDAFLGAIGVDDAHTCGLSWGGVLALELYRRHPERIRSLILAGTYVGWRGSLGAQAARARLEANLRQSEMQPSEFLPEMISGLVTPTAPEDLRSELFGFLSEFHPAGFRGMARAVFDADQRDVLPTIRVPTLLVWGELDQRSPLSVARQFHEAIPDARLEVLPGAGHLCNFDQPEDFNAAVRDFCLAQTPA